MKNKINKIMGVVLTASMLLAVLASFIPAQTAKAGTLEWSAESLPGTSQVSNFQMTDFAVAANGTTIYAVNGSTNGLKKSTNGGSSWTSVTSSTALLPFAATFVSVAPDNDQIVVIASATNNVAIATDGAVLNTSFTELAAPGTAAITDLAFSSAVSGVRQIVVSGATAAPLPAVFAFNYGDAVPSWTNTLANVAAPFPASQWGGTVDGTAATTIVRAVTFSSNYASDRILLAVSSDAATGQAFLNIASFNAKRWNNAGSTDTNGIFQDYDGAVNIIADSNVAAGLTSASIAVGPSYSGGDPSTRVSFVGLAEVNGDIAGVYRMDDATKKFLSPSNVRIKSVAYNGTLLVAGQQDLNRARTTKNPLSNTPDWTVTTGFQSPGGTDGAAVEDTIVAFGGTNVYASTRGADAAFSLSKDDGVSFNDISLVNTRSFFSALSTTTAASTHSIINDIAIAPDGSKWYMVASDDTTVNVWRKTGTTWERVLALPGQVALSADNIVRIAPENAAAIYLAAQAANNVTVWFSDDSGEKSWSLRTAPPVGANALSDLAVESASVAYALFTNQITKSSNAALTWGHPDPASTFTSISVGTLTGALGQVVSLSKDNVLVAGTNNVAYSTDGGKVWTTPTGSISGATTLRVTADKLATGGFIYAVATNLINDTIYRRSIGATEWVKINSTALAGVNEAYSDIHLGAGVLHATSFIGGTGAPPAVVAGTGRLHRTLDPTKSATTDAASSQVEFSVVAATSNIGLPVQFGKMIRFSTSTSGTVVWAISNSPFASNNVAAPGNFDSTNANRVLSFTDTLAKAGPTLTGPADNFSSGVNLVSGLPNPVNFTWGRISSATAYRVDIALDNAFVQKVVPNALVASTDDSVFASTSTLVAGGVVLTPNTTYYWRVRASAPVFSPYSTARSFRVGGELPTPTPVPIDKTVKIDAPFNGATGVALRPTFAWQGVPGATNYFFQLSSSAGFEDANIVVMNNALSITSFVPDKDLEYNKVYYWRVRALVAGSYGAYTNGIFTTMARPTPAAPPITVTQAPPITIPPSPPPETPAYIWAIIAIGAILVIVVIILIVRTRRV